MKKLLLGILLSLVSFSGIARENVTIVWPFSIGSTQATFVRLLIKDANAAQDKYTFILENKPGAGGSIAAAYTLNSHSPTILATSGTFFIRSIFYPADPYKVELFTPILLQASGQPFTISSIKYPTLEAMSKAKNVSVGLSGYGSSTHLFASIINKSLGNLQMIPYKGTIEATKDVLGGNLDATIEFLADLEPYIDSTPIKIVGISGNKNIKQFKTMGSQKVPGLDQFVNSYWLLVPKDTPQDLVNELYSLFYKVNHSDDVNKLYKTDYQTAQHLTLPETNKAYIEQIEFWRKQSIGVKLAE